MISNIIRLTMFLLTIVIMLTTTSCIFKHVNAESCDGLECQQNSLNEMKKNLNQLEKLIDDKTQESKSEGSKPSLGIAKSESSKDSGESKSLLSSITKPLVGEKGKEKGEEKISLKKVEEMIKKLASGGKDKGKRSGGGGGGSDSDDPAAKLVDLLKTTTSKMTEAGIRAPLKGIEDIIKKLGKPDSRSGLAGDIESQDDNGELRDSINSMIDQLSQQQQQQQQDQSQNNAGQDNSIADNISNIFKQALGGDSASNNDAGSSNNNNEDSNSGLDS